MSSAATGGLRVTGIDIHTYLTRDARTSIAFYRDVLGLIPQTIFDDDRGAEFELPDGSTFGLWDPRGDMPFQPGHGIMFAVDDFEGAVATAKARGVPILHVEDTPVCHMAFGTDPDGNQLILHRRKSAGG